MSKQVDETHKQYVMRCADVYATESGNKVENREALERALDAALTPGEPDDKRQERALSHAYCLYSNLAKTDDAAMQAFRLAWVEAFTHGFQCGRTSAPPAQTPQPRLTNLSDLLFDYGYDPEDEHMLALLRKVESIVRIQLGIKDQEGGAA